MLLQRPSQGITVGPGVQAVSLATDAPGANGLITIDAPILANGADVDVSQAEQGRLPLPALAAVGVVGLVGVGFALLDPFGDADGDPAASGPQPTATATVPAPTPVSTAVPVSRP